MNISESIRARVKFARTFWLEQVNNVQQSFYKSPPKPNDKSSDIPNTEEGKKVFVLSQRSSLTSSPLEKTEKERYRLLSITIFSVREERKVEPKPLSSSPPSFESSIIKIVENEVDPDDNEDTLPPSQVELPATNEGYFKKPEKDKSREVSYSCVNNFMFFINSSSNHFAKWPLIHR